MPVTSNPCPGDHKTDALKAICYLQDLTEARYVHRFGNFLRQKLGLCCQEKSAVLGDSFSGAKC